MIDTQRHASVFSPDHWGERRVDVVGVGATGSRVALALAKLGVRNLHWWDFDVVEPHNLANQVYREQDVGREKAVALYDVIRESIGEPPRSMTARVTRVTGKEELGEVVFLLVDTMAARKEIWEGALKFQLRTRLMVETRMGADQGFLYTLCPSRPTHVSRWEDTLFTDEEAETSLCGTSVSVGPTADVLSGMAVWSFLRYAAREKDPRVTEELENQTLIGLRPFTIYSQTWR